MALIVAAPSMVFSQAAGEEETFTVALTGKYPPFSMIGPNGELQGFDVDVSREVAERLGQELELVQTEWDGILAGLLAGKFDAIIGSMAITPARQEQVNFSHPYYVSGAQLFVRRNDENQYGSLDDLEGENVGVVLGTTFEQYLTENYPSVNVRTYKGDVDIFQDMQNERIAGFVTDRLVGSYQVKAAEMPFTPAGELLYEERMGIPVTKDREDLLARINQALIAMENEGVFENLHDKWFGLEGGGPAQTEVTTGLIARKLGYGFLVTLQVAFLSLAIGFAASIPIGLLLNAEGLAPVRIPVRFVVDFIRGTPVLVQLFFVYFGAPQAGLTLTPMQSAVLALSVNAACYMAEVVRSGLMSVDRGQALAAKALGLTQWQSFRYVIWPQAFRIAIPPLVNSAVALLKDTALISVISVGEVLREAQSLISITFDPMKFYLIVGVLFFLFTYPLMLLAGRLESRIKQKGYS